MRLGHIHHVGTAICKISKFAENELYEDEFYGPYLVISGQCYMAPYLYNMYFGEYGPIAYEDEQKIIMRDDFEFLIKDPEDPEEARRQVLYLDFIKYMAAINKGKTIGGLTYEESFEKRFRECLENKRKKAHAEVDKKIDQSMMEMSKIAMTLCSEDQDERQ